MDVRQALPEVFFTDGNLSAQGPHGGQGEGGIEVLVIAFE
jgi:hypothetical protein